MRKMLIATGLFLLAVLVCRNVFVAPPEPEPGPMLMVFEPVSDEPIPLDEEALVNAIARMAERSSDALKIQKEMLAHARRRNLPEDYVVRLIRKQLDLQLSRSLAEMKQRQKHPVYPLYNLGIEYADIGDLEKGAELVRQGWDYKNRVEDFGYGANHHTALRCEEVGLHEEARWILKDMSRLLGSRNEPQAFSERNQQFELQVVIGEYDDAMATMKEIVKYHPGSRYDIERYRGNARSAHIDRYHFADFDADRAKMPQTERYYLRIIEAMCDEGQFDEATAIKNKLATDSAREVTDRMFAGSLAAASRWEKAYETAERLRQTSYRADTIKDIIRQETVAGRYREANEKLTKYFPVKDPADGSWENYLRELGARQIASGDVEGGQAFLAEKFPDERSRLEAIFYVGRYADRSRSDYIEFLTGIYDLIPDDSAFAMGKYTALESLYHQQEMDYDKEALEQKKRNACRKIAESPEKLSDTEAFSLVQKLVELNDPQTAAKVAKEKNLSQKLDTFALVASSEFERRIANSDTLARLYYLSGQTEEYDALLKMVEELVEEHVKTEEARYDRILKNWQGTMGSPPARETYLSISDYPKRIEMFAHFAAGETDAGMELFSQMQYLNRKHVFGRALIYDVVDDVEQYLRDRGEFEKLESFYATSYHESELGRRIRFFYQHLYAVGETEKAEELAERHGLTEQETFELKFYSLLEQNRFDEALEIINTLPAEQQNRKLSLTQTLRFYYSRALAMNRTDR